MGILSSLYTGVSGMTAQGDALSVIGDNIANANTIGFKASRAEFENVMGSGSPIGRGVKLSVVNPLITQGNIDGTEKATDLAISGDGFFKLRGTDGDSFTRNGSFHFDNDGYLVSNDNQKVQGFSIDEKGNVVNKIQDIKFPRALVPAKATKELKLELNLDSRMEANRKFDAKDPYSTSHYSTGLEMYDSQGNKHLVSFFFNKVADRTWEWKGLVDGQELTGGSEGVFSQVCAGKITFTEDGKLAAQEVTQNSFNFKGGAMQNQQLKFNFGDDIKSGGKGLDGTKQYGKNSDIITWSQDGAAAGSITGLSFNDSGIMTAMYSNGKAVELAQVAIAKFANPEALTKVGNNRLKESGFSGEPSLGGPGTAGRGKLVTRALERSTVDLATEFVNMIQNQRGFQANSKTITTTDELLNEIIQLKR